MKIPYFCCIGAELKRYEKDFDFMNQVYLYKIPADDTIEEVLAQDYFQPVADTVLQDDILYIYEPTSQVLHTCRFKKQNGHITAEQMANNVPGLTPNRVLTSDENGRITAGDVTLEYLKNKVNLDGASIMTGPLKFKAGSFEGAIAGGLGDGISVYKLKADGSIDSEVASLTKTNGFVPGTNNAMNIGRNNLKWKDAYIARVITAVINNGYDIAVPVTNSADTLALKSEVDLAANSGDQLTEKGVWYAKMYSATVAPSAEDGTNYADFSQTDGQGNPIIVIYKRQNGAWVQDQTITPPAEYNGYVPVTSKIWDIVEQSGQQGGKVLWSHNQKTFTPSPLIISFEDIEITGDSTVVMPATPTDNSIPTKKYVDDAVAGSGGGYHPGLFAREWDDHLRNDPQWLRADTFSWQDGSAYEAAYNHLVDDINEHEILYRWYDSHYDEECYTKTSTPTVGGNAYDANGQVIGTIEAYDSQYNTILVNAIEYARDSSGDIYSGFSTETVAGTTITYYLSADGHKIVLPDQESNVAAIYAATGVAWYYIIDEANQRFKLPRSKHNKYAASNPVIGNGSALGITEGTNTGSFASSSTATNNPVIANDGYGKAVGTSVSYNGWTDLKAIGVTTDSAKSGLIAQQTEDTDQYKYLYFYVGSFTQTALENTAGLNAELFNGKADLNLANVLANIDFVVERQEPTAANNYTWYRKYRSGWVEQGGVASTTNTSTPTQCNLPVTMADGGYCITYGPTTAGMYTVFLSSKQTTYFSVITGVQNVGYFATAFNWMVCGMAAS